MRKIVFHLFGSINKNPLSTAVNTASGKIQFSLTSLNSQINSVLAQCVFTPFPLSDQSISLLADCPTPVTISTDTAFILHAYIPTLSAGDNISANIVPLANFVAVSSPSDIIPGNSVPTSAFVWSDKSAPDHSSDSSDYTNEFFWHTSWMGNKVQSGSF